MVRLQAKDDYMQGQAEAMLQKLKLPLQHKISTGPLPVSLQKTAAVLGMSADTLKSRMWGGRKLDIEETAEQQAIYTILVPVLLDLQQQLNDNASTIEELQQTDRCDPMLACIRTFLGGQMDIVDIALEHIADFR